ncbi:MAG TPA: MBL fold metallo-hydrolase, partial [Parafilimonas sp.]
MSLFIASLNSGSNGNCYYVGNNAEAVLIDAGISCRETEKRMLRLGLSIKNVKAIFISHEHDDHICGCESLANKHNIPVYITEATLQN